MDSIALRYCRACKELDDDMKTPPCPNRGLVSQNFDEDRKREESFKKIPQYAAHGASH
jgi:hypothetical protein